MRYHAIRWAADVIGGYSAQIRQLEARNEVSDIIRARLSDFARSDCLSSEREDENRVRKIR